MKLIEGICFLCGNSCKQYVHFECAISYSYKKEEIAREEQILKEKKQDKYLDKLLKKQRKR